MLCFGINHNPVQLLAYFNSLFLTSLVLLSQDFHKFLWHKVRLFYRTIISFTVLHWNSTYKLYFTTQMYKDINPLDLNSTSTLQSSKIVDNFSLSTILLYSLPCLVVLDNCEVRFYFLVNSLSFFWTVLEPGYEITIKMCVFVFLAFVKCVPVKLSLCFCHIFNN